MTRYELHRAGRFTALKSFAMAQHGQSRRLSGNITDMVDTARMIPWRQHGQGLRNPSRPSEGK